jgi:hypothetical protein
MKADTSGQARTRRRRLVAPDQKSSEIQLECVSLFDDVVLNIGSTHRLLEGYPPFGSWTVLFYVNSVAIYLSHHIWSCYQQVFDRYVFRATMWKVFTRNYLVPNPTWPRIARQTSPWHNLPNREAVPQMKLPYNNQKSHVDNSVALQLGQLEEAAHTVVGILSVGSSC